MRKGKVEVVVEKDSEVALYRKKVGGGVLRADGDAKTLKTFCAAQRAVKPWKAVL